MKASSLHLLYRSVNVMELLLAMQTCFVYCQFYFFFLFYFCSCKQCLLAQGASPFPKFLGQRKTSSRE